MIDHGCSRSHVMKSGIGNLIFEINEALIVVITKITCAHSNPCLLRQVMKLDMFHESIYFYFALCHVPVARMWSWPRGSYFRWISLFSKTSTTYRRMRVWQSLCSIWLSRLDFPATHHLLPSQNPNRSYIHLLEEKGQSYDWLHL